MRGYEITEAEVSTLISTGYESPCGVMRNVALTVVLPPATLRIPMRGYESLPGIISNCAKRVTNPHAGL